jgi:hypothetical protein
MIDDPGTARRIERDCHGFKADWYRGNGLQTTGGGKNLKSIVGCVHGEQSLTVGGQSNRPYLSRLERDERLRAGCRPRARKGIAGWRSYWGWRRWWLHPATIARRTAATGCQEQNGKPYQYAWSKLPHESPTPAC